MDSETRYKAQPHPIFGPEDIIYRFNCYGYRCPEFEMRHSTQEDAIHVVSVGCSLTLGTGVREEQTYPAIFKKHLQNHLGYLVINWNLGLGGGSADYMARILTSALPILKPHIVLLTFPPGMARREYINENSRSFNCIPMNQAGLMNFTDPARASVLNAHKELLSSYNNLLNLFKNYKVCEASCQQFEVMWLFSAADVAIFDSMTHLIQMDKLIPPGLGVLTRQYKNNPEIGLARDMVHPGIQPMQEYAEALFSQLKQLYSSQLETLKPGKVE